MSRRDQPTRVPSGNRYVAPRPGEKRSGKNEKQQIILLRRRQSFFFSRICTDQ